MSVTKVGKNKYRIFVSDGFNLDGTRRRSSMTIETDLKGRDLKAFLAKAELEFEEEVKKRDPKFDNLAKGTFEEYSIWWINHKETFDDIAIKTKNEYQKLLDTRILNYIGNKILSKITNADMMDLIELIKNSPAKTQTGRLSDNSVKHYHVLLKNMFSDAVLFKIITENPMENVNFKAPRAQLKDNYYEHEDIGALLNILPVAPVKYQLLVLLALTLGPRCGELTAVRWGALNYISLKLKFLESNAYVEGIGSFIKDPKNDTSVREVAFPRFLVPLFEQHERDELAKKDILGDKWFYGKEHKHENDFIFTQKNGKVMYVSTPSQWFGKLLKEHDLRKITFHGLRHTNTTVLISEGVDIVDVSRGLGHAKTSTTTDFYAHVLKSSERKKADVFDNIYTQNKEEKQEENESGTRSGTKAPYLRVVK